MNYLQQQFLKGDVKAFCKSAIHENDDIPKIDKFNYVTALMQRHARSLLTRSPLKDWLLETQHSTKNTHKY